MSTPPPLLLAAYQCGPGLGSVSQIGWEWYRRLAARGPVTLVTHARNRAAIEAAPDLPPEADILWVDTEWFAGPLYRLAKRVFPCSEHCVFLMASLDFFVFDRLALGQARALKAKRNWALTHIVTPVTLAAPSCLHGLGLPVVRGPLNCGLQSPPGFREQLRHESEWLIRLRRLGGWLDHLIGASRHCARILTATAATRAAVPTRHRARCVAMLENAVTLERYHASPWPVAPGPGQPLRVLFVGRMIALKGVDLLLRALSQLHQQGLPVCLELIGDGSERGPWQALAQALGIGGQVHFAGAQDAEAVARALRECHVLCLPSVRESGGAVLLEAMASARPVIAVAHGGPAELVDDEVGAAIPPESPASVIRALAGHLSDCFAQPERWAGRGRAGRERVERLHHWEARLDAACSLYHEVLDPSTEEFAVTSQKAVGVGL